MILKFSLGSDCGTLAVQREPGDSKAKASGFTRDVHGWGPEIHLLSMLLKRLNLCGFNLASVKVADDGHMYGDDYMRYLRTPKKALRKSDVPFPYIYVVDGDYVLRSSADAFNHGEEVRFVVHGDVFADYPQPDWCRKVKALCDHHGIECELHEPVEV